MRSASSTKRMSVHVHSPMPGHYKSCRRSTGELFAKDQEQDLDRGIQKCASPDVSMKADYEQSLEMQEVTPPKLTPLKWRSTSMKELNSALATAGSGSPAKVSVPIHPMKELNNAIATAGSGSPAKVSVPIHPEPFLPGPEVSRLQSPNKLSPSLHPLNSQSTERVSNVRHGRSPSKGQIPEPTTAAHERGNILQNGVVNLALAGRFGIPVEKTFSTDNLPQVNADSRETIVNNRSEGKDSMLRTYGDEEHVKTPSRDFANGVLSPKPKEFENVVARKDNILETSRGEDIGKMPVLETSRSEASRKMPVLETSNGEENRKKPVRSRSSGAEPMEEIVFQPVDLDMKYRTEELVRHVTAAKIQNREEALLNNPGPLPSNGRNVPVGQEPAAMTIEFLRARLQAERSASKTTKLRMEQLAKKVTELENKLISEVELRKCAEFALQDALSKLKKSTPQSDEGGRPSPLAVTAKVANAEVVKNEEKIALPSAGRTESEAEVAKSMAESPRENALDSNSVSKEEKEHHGVETPARVGDLEPPSSSEEVSGNNAVNEGGLWSNRSVEHLAQDSFQTANVDEEERNGVTKVSPASVSGSSPERVITPTLQRQDLKAEIEERLRSMWSKIREEMAALAEVQGVEETDQSLAFLEDKQPTGDGESGPDHRRLLTESRSNVSTPRKQGGNAVAPATPEQVSIASLDPVSNVAQEQISSKLTDASEKRSRSFTRNASLAKNVARLVEQFEFQETAQREWEENFEARQLLEQNANESEVISETESDQKVHYAKGDVLSPQSLKVPGGAISRSKSLGFLPSQQGGPQRKHSRKGSANGHVEILAENYREQWVDDEQLMFDAETEMAEELPNGIYLHHSRDDVDSQQRRGGRDAMYRNATERVDRHRGDGQRGMGAWQDGVDSGMGSRGISSNHYGFPAAYGIDETRQAQYGDPQYAQYAQPSPYGDPRAYGDVGSYGGRREMQFMGHPPNSTRSEYYPPNVPVGMQQQRSSMGRHVPSDRSPPVSQGYNNGWSGASPHKERVAAMGVPQESPGEASQVLKALRIAKQQIKSSTIEQAAVVTAQYTVSQEHRYGAGGQVSKTSYTVEAPVGFRRNEGWHLGGKPVSKKHGGFGGTNGTTIDLSSADVTDLIGTTGPVTATNGESSYVEKLNVGRGIQFFFTG